MWGSLRARGKEGGATHSNEFSILHLHSLAGALFDMLYWSRLAGLCAEWLLTNATWPPLPELPACHPGTQGWEGLQSSAGRLATRVRLAFGAVTGRPRHKHRQFGRPGSPVSTSTIAYSRVGSRGEEEEGGGGSAVPERSSSLRARLQEVLVGGSGSDSSGPLVQAVQSPRQPLLGGESSSPGP